MTVALDQFFYDTLHFYIKRALERWMKQLNAAMASDKQELQQVQS